ncbi:flavodoxin [Candidatus Bathyarchaeota archaeon]|nr:flavodoxin family protein [Candidatus Bathyarchaeota archaeon]NIR13561.1 flavodoxin family protein [Desulfobacterales bacterium]NIU81193.1 flavodoxin [Candidatus Bathyarchaeota archaeon]NIV67835.1 flavodoxin [Candidatus Bathyarchaeota archaeon]NIW15866.1 flavodoxin [Candidatus Bathyarchaeota archaeon]
MKVLNLYFSSTGNTEKVALEIRDTVRELGHSVKTVKVTSGDMDVDLLQFKFIFVGSGVYGQLPGRPMIELHRKLLRKYNEKGEIKPGSPRRPSRNVVVYCTYGGVHTGIKEALPAVKFMGQLYDHLGYNILGEWYVVGEYKTDRFRHRSINGRLGDIRGRPNSQDLKEVAEKVKGTLKASSF